MSVRGNTSGEYFGEWFGPVEVVPGAMSASIGGSGGITANLVGVRAEETTNSGGYSRTSDRRRTQKEIDEARRKFGIVIPEEEPVAVVDAAVEAVKTLTLSKSLKKPKPDDFSEYRERLIAWLEADLAAQALTKRVKDRDFMIAIMVSALIAA